MYKWSASRVDPSETASGFEVGFVETFHINIVRDWSTNLDHSARRADIEERIMRVVFRTLRLFSNGPLLYFPG